MSEIPKYAWFCGDDSARFYQDGTLEIQHKELSFRAPIERWVEAAKIINLFANAEQTMDSSLAHISLPKNTVNEEKP